MDDETSFWPSRWMEYEKNVKDFGRNLRTLRKNAGYSQEAFAHAAGLDRTYIGGIERGERNPSLKTLFGIAKTLGIEPADLFRLY